MQLESSLLNEETDTSDFDCGEEKLNFYLRNLALLFQRRHFGVTIIFFEKTDLHKKIVGFYTLCPACIQREFLPGPQPNPIPALRICRLAVDKRFQGKGIGAAIFIHSLKKCSDQASQIGGSAIIIDTKHEKAKAFYERFGFIPIPPHSFTLIQTTKYIHKHFK